MKHRTDRIVDQQEVKELKNVKVYATPVQEAAILGGIGWVVCNNTITHNHSLGVDASTGWQLLYSKINRNVMAGFGGDGGKITEIASGAVIRGNCVHDNGGPESGWMNGKMTSWLKTILYGVIPAPGSCMRSAMAV